MIPINTFLEIAKNFAAVVSKLAEVTTSADEIYTVAKKVHDFVVRKMREEPPVAPGGSSEENYHDLL